MNWVAGIGIFAAVILFLWGVGVLFTTALQRFFIFRPQVMPQDFKFHFHSPFEEQFHDRPDGGRIHLLKFKANGPQKRVVFYCHGNAGDLRKWGHRYADFVPKGWDLVVWDYRGFGKSRGKLSEEALLGDSIWLAKEVAAEYGNENMIIYGRSIGSATACAAASVLKCRHVVLETPFSSMKNLFFTYYPFLPRVFPFSFHLDNVERLSRCQSPVTIFQGTRDYVVPHRCAVRLQKAFKPGDRFFTLPGAGHGNVGSFAEYEAEMEKILS